MRWDGKGNVAHERVFKIVETPRPDERKLEKKKRKVKIDNFGGACRVRRALKKGGSKRSQLYKSCKKLSTTRKEQTGKNEDRDQKGGARPGQKKVTPGR